MKTQIFKDYSDFQNREDKSINGVSIKFSEQYENWEEMNETNEGCFDCSGCSDCSDKIGSKETESNFDIPVIENIHSAVLDAVDKPNALAMDTWHTCDTTHCRAGWVVFLAGEKGKELEKKNINTFCCHADISQIKS